MMILIIHHTLGVTQINQWPDSIRKSYRRGAIRVPEEIQQRGELFINGGDIALNDQVQRGRAAGAVAQRQRLQLPWASCWRMRSSGSQPKPT